MKALAGLQSSGKATESNDKVQTSNPVAGVELSGRQTQAVRASSDSCELVSPLNLHIEQTERPLVQIRSVSPRAAIRNNSIRRR